MSPSVLETVPQTWEEPRDPVFFGLVARLFSPPETFAMSVLLASHDPEPAPRARAAARA